MKQIDVKKTILENGLRVITVHNDSGIFSIAAGIKAGSLYENENVNGISHMVEHMLFKGTQNRNMEQLNDDLDKIAGDIDIYTTYQQTVLTISVMKSHGEECLNIISDMLMNASFPPKEFKLEKNVIIEEIKMGKDDAEDISYIGLYKAAFKDISYKYNITGTIKSLREIKIKQLRDFYNNFYVPNNTAIAIASSYSHEEIVSMVKRCMGSWKGTNNVIPFERVKAEAPRKLVRHKNGIGQTHILYGFDIKGLDKREQIALMLFNKKFGGGGNSVLFKELRDSKGYAYNVYSDIDFIKGIEMMYIYAAISIENLKDVILIINTNIDKFVNEEKFIDEKTIRTIKDIFNTDIAIAMESSAHIVDYLLDGEIAYSNPTEYTTILSIMETITIDDIKEVIKKVFKNPIIHILSPLSK